MRIVAAILALVCLAMTWHQRDYEVRYRISYDWGVVDGARYQVAFAEWIR